MRRVVLGAAAVATGTVVWLRSAGRLRAMPKAAAGVFPNGVPYTRWGTAGKNLLWIVGGPGESAPRGLSVVLARFWLRPYLDSGYTVWMVSRKQHMPMGYTIADMAEDYAQLIADRFDGRIDLVLGESYGGMIGFWLAARHPECFAHIAIVAAGAYVPDERARTIDLEFARLLAGRTGEAGALLVRFLYPDMRVPGAARVVGAVLGHLMFAETHPYYRHDVLIEAQADLAFDAREVLPEIRVPVLLIGGDRDQYTPKSVYEETARLIPDCTLVLYEGKDHLGAINDRRLHRDVLDFVARQPRTRSAERPRGPVPEPVVGRA